MGSQKDNRHVSAQEFEGLLRFEAADPRHAHIEYDATGAIGGAILAKSSSTLAKLAVARPTSFKSSDNICRTPVSSSTMKTVL